MSRTSLLARTPPFDGLDPEALRDLGASSVEVRLAKGSLVLDAFRDPTVDVFVVRSGRVALWSDTDATDGPPDEFVGPLGLFGFSAMLTERAIGPRAVAAEDAVLLRVPGSAAAPAFESAAGVRFLAASGPARRYAQAAPGYSTVDDLIVTTPLLVPADTPVAEVARRMTSAGTTYAAVTLESGYGLVTDAVLRRRVLGEGLDPRTPAEQVMVPSGPTALLGDSAVEALISLLERDADVQLVTDRDGRLAGAVVPRDFAILPSSASASVHEQLRRAATVADLQVAARRVPAMLTELLAHGLASGRVIALHSSVLDTVVRRAIDLVLADHPDLDPDAFTWLSLGSNGRREAVPSSDVDSAVAFTDDVTPDQALRYREAFAVVDAVLVGAGLSRDTHGATAQQALFARTNAQWREAGQHWLSAPVDDNGAMMASLLVDARPIHGDPGLPEVARVFAELRTHPGTMRLLLQESLAGRARRHFVVDVFRGRADTFDLKAHALQPVVNIARWAALSIGSPALPTVDRLRGSAGSTMLPESVASTLVEVFEVLQRLRLRYQLRQIDAGETPTDVLELDRVSPIDRSVITEAVREVAAAQRRMTNIAAYVEPDAWLRPGPG